MAIKTIFYINVLSFIIGITAVKAAMEAPCEFDPVGPKNNFSPSSPMNISSFSAFPKAEVLQRSGGSLERTLAERFSAPFKKGLPGLSSSSPDLCYMSLKGPVGLPKGSPVYIREGKGTPPNLFVHIYSENSEGKNTSFSSPVLVRTAEGVYTPAAVNNPPFQGNGSSFYNSGS